MVEDALRPGIGFIVDDGGRAAAGIKGKGRDCCCRAFAIASGRPYLEVQALINEYAAKERTGKRRNGQPGKSKSNPRTGVYMTTAKKVAERLGATWTPTMRIGSGCTTHLDENLPVGRLVVRVSGHYAAVVDRVVRDTYLDDRGGTRCVYGYWSFPALK